MPKLPPEATVMRCSSYSLGWGEGRIRRNLVESQDFQYNQAVMRPFYTVVLVKRTWVDGISILSSTNEVPPILGSNGDKGGYLDFYLHLTVKRQALDQCQRNPVK